VIWYYSIEFLKRRDVWWKRHITKPSARRLLVLGVAGRPSSVADSLAELGRHFFERCVARFGNDRAVAAVTRSSGTMKRTVDFFSFSAGI
jgi:Na+-driven multidrug efflux pump